MHQNLNNYSIPIRIKLQAPFITLESGTMAREYDATMWRYKGVPAIPGTLVRGNIRHALNHFASLTHGKKLFDRIEYWFGKEFNNDSFGYVPKRSHLHFDYAWQLIESDTASISSTPINQTRYRIKIAQDSGIVEKGSFQAIESPFLTGQTPVFEGCVRTRLTQEEKKELTNWLSKALSYIAALGSFKGAGFGKILHAEVLPIEESIPREELKLCVENQTRHIIDFKLDRPFCIATRSSSDTNNLLSNDVIPGNVLKGAIAQFYFNSFGGSIYPNQM